MVLGDANSYSLPTNLTVFLKFYSLMSIKYILYGYVRFNMDFLYYGMQSEIVIWQANNKSTVKI